MKKYLILLLLVLVSDSYGYYNASAGKWLSRDPIQEEGGINLYAFVNNDGANSWDVLGYYSSDFMLWGGGKSF